MLDRHDLSQRAARRRPGGRTLPLALATAAIAIAIGIACGNGSTGPGADGGPGGGPATAIAIGVVGGSGEDEVRDVAIGAQGTLYITGVTRSPDFPVTPGTYQTAFNPGPRTAGGTAADAFVLELSPTGELRWSTLVGGPHHDRAYGIEIDSQGFIYLGGRAGPGFPTTAGVLQPDFWGGVDEVPYGPQDGFVCKMAPDGKSMVFCTYFGGAGNRIVRDIAVAPDGAIYVASAREPGGLPASIAGALTNALRGGDADALIAKISPDGTRVEWATHLGGSGHEGNTNSVRLDGAGNPYIIFGSQSCDIPEIGAGAAQPTCGGGGDIVVTRLNPSTGAVVWSTYLGGSDIDGLETHELAVTADGTVFVAAHTYSHDFPIVGNAVQRTHGGGNIDLFVARISSDGSRLEASTLLGGSEDDDAQGVAVNSAGEVFLTGSTWSADFPVTSNALQPGYGGGRDAVVVKLSRDLDRLLYSSFLGGSAQERGRAAAVLADRFLFGGPTESANFPSRGAAPSIIAGGRDAAFGALTISDR